MAKRKQISWPLFALITMAATVMAASSAVADELALPEVEVPLGVTADETLGSRADDIGLPVGTRVAGFTIDSHEGDPTSLDALLEDAPLLVIFYRGGWCPYCNAQIRQLTEAYPEFEQRGVLPVLISVDETDAAALAQRSYEIPFPVLSDPDLEAHEAFDVVMSVDAETVEQYKNYGIDLEAWSKRDHHKIAVSSAFIVDGGGVVRWAHTSPDYKTRPSPEQLLAALDSVD